MHRRVRLLTVPLTALLSVYLNQSVSNLIVELMLQATIVSLAIVYVVAATKTEHQQVERFAKRALAAIGLLLICYAAYSWLSSLGNIRWGDVTLQLALPIWLSLGVLPFLFGVHVFSAYQSATKRITLIDRGRYSGLQAATALLLKFKLRTEPLSSFTPYWARRTGEASSVHEKQRVLEEFLADMETSKRQEEERLQRYAGVQGIDEWGYQLDQREIEETKTALLRLGSYHMGWYRNRNTGGIYRPDLLDLLARSFVRDGLPSDHGISMHVSDDGQRWWAWRRTVTGWCFAIGASGPPPNRWLYDGPEPPEGYPGEDPMWGERRDEHAANW